MGVWDTIEGLNSLVPAKNEMATKATADLIIIFPPIRLIGYEKLKYSSPKNLM
ncbi:hypothetical protein DSM106972_046200 [Dulcicalothrix desertica PCC 7102]|uniref:Uncharacterized protein n=1 Tax=Dulcicalothrix desertica PCC 7102 TaxID=232991 RepID=A0A3S1D6J2_9CYAN|nr:hypothetical protein DSM106972_046200 [Dulcicalothrix desertica PCC 7102]